MQKKDAYWFPHDYDPVGDPKIQAFLSEFKAEGYGIYWRIVEMLHAEATHRLPFKKYTFQAIAGQMQSNVGQVEAIVGQLIESYELFQRDESFFWSNRVDRNIDTKLSISKVRSEAGKVGRKKQLNGHNRQK